MAVAKQCFNLQKSIGLLTTVADLSATYKIKFIKTDSPLDLSVKPVLSPLTPPSTPSPLKKRYRDKDFSDDLKETVKILKPNVIGETTPTKTIKVTSPPRTGKSKQPPKVIKKKHKSIRKLKFDEDTSSPVSGTVIRRLEEIGDDEICQPGDIDPEYNIVEVTDEAKAELAEILNVIGPYNCKLCRGEFEDAFGLARHRCSCIVLLEYRCPECDKRFNCPANLASHRRWHKPKDEVIRKQNEFSENDQQFFCPECNKVFKRQAYLRKHLLTHRQKENKVKKSNFKYEIASSTSESISSTDSAYHLKITDLNINIRSARFPTTHESTLTEEESIAASALQHLRNGSVIVHG